jgi:hypothetical protein
MMVLLLPVKLYCSGKYVNVVFFYEPRWHLLGHRSFGLSSGVPFAADVNE